MKFIREYEILFFEKFVDRINLKEDLVNVICIKYSIENIDMYCKMCDLLICKECRRIIDYEGGYEIVLL